MLVSLDYNIKSGFLPVKIDLSNLESMDTSINLTSAGSLSPFLMTTKN